MRKWSMQELGRKSIADFKEAPKTPLVVVLDNIRSMHNVGSVFRTADSFLVEKMYLCGYTPQPPHRDINKTALGATETVAWEYAAITVEAVKALQEQGYRLFLATAKPEVYAKQILEHFDLLQYFEYPYGSELNGERTNKGDLIEYILKKEQLDSAECLMVGDREHDILGARRHGIETIAVEYGYGSSAELDAAEPKARIQQFSEILNHVGH